MNKEYITKIFKYIAGYNLKCISNDEEYIKYTYSGMINKTKWNTVSIDNAMAYYNYGYFKMFGHIDYSAIKLTYSLFL